MTSRENDLKDLHERMRKCRRCVKPGYAIIPKAIFSGSIGAKIMIIGQAPGVTEVEAGRPFNAGSGKRLFEWLEKAGLDETCFRSAQYMTSVTKCFPGKVKNGNGDRVPSQEEQALCRPFLNQEIQMINPRIILPVGRLAINLFFPSDVPLGEIIGTEIQVDQHRIIPFPHPSGASRWHQVEENRNKIEKSIDLLTNYLDQIGFKRDLHTSE